MIAVFVGPTLELSKASKILDATYLPPARQGDIYNISLKKPEIIVLIDGYFDREPAVSHKEILWAMSQGIHVFGCSSMGALRAAELHPFGMKGFGVVFKEYLNGTIEDDDEVVLLHGSPENGYKAFSEPMINIRYTLKNAFKSGLISVDLHDQLIEIAKSTFYSKRRYSDIYDRALENGADPQIIEQLRQWVAIHFTDQKKEDACQLLKHIREELPALKMQFEYQYYFENTGIWNELVQYSNRDPVDVLTSITPDDSRNNEYDNKILDVSVNRTLKLNEADRLGFSVSEELLYEQILRFREQKKLIHEDSLNSWIAKNDMTLREFFILMEEEAKIYWVDQLVTKEVKERYSIGLRNYNVLEGASSSLNKH